MRRVLVRLADDPGPPGRQAACGLPPDERAAPHRRHRRLLREWDPWLADLFDRTRTPDLDRRAAFAERESEVRGVPCRALELTGEPGDAVVCNLGMLHSAAPNHLDDPRVMRVKFLFLDEDAKV